MLTQRINDVRTQTSIRKMISTRHHKTAYKSKLSADSWYNRHNLLFTQLGKELGFMVDTNLTDRPNLERLALTKEGLGDFSICLYWVRDGLSTVQVSGNCTDSSIETYREWRGSDKPKSHNDGQLGNWFIKLVRRDWFESNRPDINKINTGDEIVFSATPAGGGQRTRAKVLVRGGEWGMNYFTVELLEERGVHKMKGIGSIMEVHYESIIHHASPTSLKVTNRH